MEEFKEKSFGERVKSMLKADFLRTFKTPLFYIIAGICLLIPVLMLVMTGMMGEGDTATFTSVWQAISSVSGSSGGMSMDLTSMCNMNLVYFAVGVFICLYISAEFKSGYAKNLFTHRAKKTDYVFSKTVVAFIAGIIMILAFFIGAMVGGGIAGLSFEMSGFNVGNLIACLITKMLLVAVFAPIFIAMSVIGKQRAWLSIILSLGVGMLLFTMISMMTPLNAGIMQVVLCAAGGAMFAVGLGAVSNLILKKTNIL